MPDMMRVMEPLKPPHSHFLSAAEGWLGLGNVAEAKVELTRIDESLQEHPEVLEVRWAILAEEKDWPQALEVARELARRFPESPTGWLHQAYAIRRVKEGGLAAAWELLQPAMERFPGIAIVPYNLACYACQMNRLGEARDLLKRAIRIGGKSEIQRIALADSDLEPLWAEIKGM